MLVTVVRHRMSASLLLFVVVLRPSPTPEPACAVQPRVLRWGLIAAVVLRGIFIFTGLAIVERFEPVLLVFAGVLLYSAYGLFFEEEEEEEDLSDVRSTASYAG